ncbi:MAG: YdcF family protein [Ilumatobacteraceae bacterium]
MRRVLLAGLAAFVIWGEWIAHHESRRRATPLTGPPASEVIVVLGCSNRGERANAVNRWRVRTAIRSFDPTAGRRTLVCCGGAVAGSTSEAALMAAYAVEQGVVDEVVLEQASRSTWENVANAVPLVDGFERIKLVSDPFHARRAEQYLAMQRPDLAARLAPAAPYRFGEGLPLSPLLTLYGWARLQVRR